MPSATAHDEVLSALNELLEAERAGARVAFRNAKEVLEPELKSLVTAIQRDEAHWCDMLTKTIHRLGFESSKKTGMFYDKAMAILDVPSRLAFLNRGQSWVVRKLEALLPSVRDDLIRTDLGAMLSTHERNIALVAARLPSGSPPQAELPRAVCRND